MAVRVMLVDDSTIVRGLIARALTVTPDIEIVATAFNGAMAIPIAQEHQPDIIILDIEMPEMDGITALPKLLQAAPKTKIIMASTLTVRNAGISMQALELGASDYVAKPSARLPEELEIFYRELREKIHALAGARTQRTRSSVVSAPPVASSANSITLLSPHAPLAAPVKELAIASSTGGPQALLKLFSDIKGKLNHLPIFLTQHMPPTFTSILAEHLSKAGERTCMEAKNGDEVKPGHAYVAPGDYHMLVVQENGKAVLRINQGPPINFCRPAADPMFQSLSKVYGKHLLAVILTGMGQDGFEGAKTIVAGGGSVIAQDEATSVVWGMPKAVATNNLCRAVLPLPGIPGYLLQHIGN